jgi:hypothetical protein
MEGERGDPTMPLGLARSLSVTELVVVFVVVLLIRLTIRVLRGR